MINVAQKNRRTGILLAFIAASLFVYSFFVIRTRGRIPEPEHMTPAQKILRGL